MYHDFFLTGYGDLRRRVMYEDGAWYRTEPQLSNLSTAILQELPIPQLSSE
jgi:hypothetical protein